MKNIFKIQLLSKLSIAQKVVILLVASVLILYFLGGEVLMIGKPEFTDKSSAKYDTSDTEIIFKISDETLDRRMPVYKIKSIKIKNSEVKKLLSAFGFEKPKKEVDGSITYYREGEKELKISQNGGYHYTVKNNSGSFLLSEESIKAEAEKFLLEKELLPDDFEFAGYSKTENSNVNTTSTSAMSAIFARKIDGHSVAGTKATISVEFNQNGLSSVKREDNEKYRKKGTVKCDSFENLKDKILSDEANISYGGKEAFKVKRIEITECEIIYYKGSGVIDKKYLQPCIRFTGTAFDDSGNSTSFSSTVPMRK